MLRKKDHPKDEDDLQDEDNQFIEDNPLKEDNTQSLNYLAFDEKLEYLK